MFEMFKGIWCAACCLIIPFALIWPAVFVDEIYTIKNVSYMNSFPNASVVLGYKQVSMQLHGYTSVMNVSYDKSVSYHNAYQDCLQFVNDSSKSIYNSSDCNLFHVWNTKSQYMYPVTIVCALMISFALVIAWGNACGCNCCVFQYANEWILLCVGCGGLVAPIILCIFILIDYNSYYKESLDIFGQMYFNQDLDNDGWKSIKISAVLILFIILIVVNFVIACSDIIAWNNYRSHKKPNSDIPYNQL